MLDIRQVRDLVVRPALEHLGLPGGLTAERLIMGTAAQESGFSHLAQVGGGPALGLWQMEPATFRDVWNRWIRTPGRQGLLRKVDDLLARSPEPVAQLVGNLSFACAMARVLYYSRPFSMPQAGTVAELAMIWKQYYNTPKGAGTPDQFVANYRRLVAPLYEG